LIRNYDYIESNIYFEFFLILFASHFALEVQMINIELTDCLHSLRHISRWKSRWMIDPLYPCIATLGKSDRSYMLRYTVCNIFHSWYMCWLHKVPYRENQHHNIIPEIFQNSTKIALSYLVIGLNISYLTFLEIKNQFGYTYIKFTLIIFILIIFGYPYIKILHFFIHVYFIKRLLII